jgi:hypothetical protein
MRQHVQVQPFRVDLLGYPKILEAKVKWDKEQRDLAQLEYQRFLAGAEFDFEPQHYPWCEKLTRMENRSIMDPVTGKRSPVYILCARANEQGNCQHHTQP